MSPSSRNEKRRLFDQCRLDLAEQQISTTSVDSIICPLCWRETLYDDLSIEHIIPRKLRGKRTVLTCRPCNNQHGTQLDSHLVQFQKVRSAFQGHGSIPARIIDGDHSIEANVEWGSGFKRIEVVGKASNLAHEAAIREKLNAGKLTSFELQLHHGYSVSAFQTAVLRCAYLALFQRAGYGYLKHPVVQEELLSKVVDGRFQAAASWGLIPSMYWIP